VLLSVIVPVFNEKLSIEQTFLNLELSLKKKKIKKNKKIFIKNTNKKEKKKIL